MSKKLLIVSESHLVKTFVARTLKKLKEDGCDTQMDCFLTAVKNASDIDFLQPYFNNLYVLPSSNKWYHQIPKLRVAIQLIRLLVLGSKLPKYDYVHFQFMHYYYAFLVLLFRLKSRFVYLTFYGSDFNQIGKLRHFFNKISCSFANTIIAENKVFLDQVQAKYDPHSKLAAIQLIPLMPVMENMFKLHVTQTRSQAKQILGFEEKDVLITCGYCGDEIMQFDLMIDCLNKLPFNAINGRTIQVIFPMTYGRDYLQNHAIVEYKMQSSKLPYRVYKNYLSNEEVTALRYATDVFVLVSKRDQAASALYEHLLAGSVVITGNWLPYEHLDHLQTNYHRVTPENLAIQLNTVLQQLTEQQLACQKNFEIINNMVSWDANKNKWLNLYTK